jgi:hypothetical protein
MHPGTSIREQASIVNHYNELTIGLIQNETKVKMNIILEFFDEGVALDMIFHKMN